MFFFFFNGFFFFFWGFASLVVVVFAQPRVGVLFDEIVEVVEESIVALLLSCLLLLRLLCWRLMFRGIYPFAWGRRQQQARGGGAGWAGWRGASRFRDFSLCLYSLLVFWLFCFVLERCFVIVFWGQDKEALFSIAYCFLCVLRIFGPHFLTKFTLMVSPSFSP